MRKASKVASQRHTAILCNDSKFSAPSHLFGSFLPFFSMSNNGRYLILQIKFGYPFKISSEFWGLLLHYHSWVGATATCLWRCLTTDTPDSLLANGNFIPNKRLKSVYSAWGVLIKSIESLWRILPKYNAKFVNSLQGKYDECKKLCVQLGKHMKENLVSCVRFFFYSST